MSSSAQGTRAGEDSEPDTADAGRVALRELPDMPSGSSEGGTLSCSCNVENPDALLTSLSLPRGQPETEMGCARPRAETDAAVEDLLRALPGVVEVHELVGRGSHGRVYCCTLEAHRERVAVKVIGRQWPQASPREARVLESLSHPNLVQLVQVMRGTPMCLILDYCSGGNVQSLIHDSPASPWFKRLGMRQRGSALVDVALALDYLHSVAVVHRDIKSANCLLSGPVLPETLEIPAVKVGDFGFARSVPGIDQSPLMTQFIGTVRYMAPEVANSNVYDTHADVYSCAILFHEILTGEVPYGRKQWDYRRLILKVAQGMRPPIEGLPGCDAGVKLRRLLESCWHAEPEKRPLAAQMRDSVHSAFS